jgi:lipid II:glycine glycyltransferase (peptidoglycan interpeptide bridge formation enzyme)
MGIRSFLTGKRGISLPFTDFCDPIVLNGIPFPDLLNCITEYGQKHDWKYLELRGGQKFLNSQHLTLNTRHSTLDIHLPCSSTYYGHTLDLVKGERQIFSGLRDSTRRNIKKAVKEGIKVEISQSPDSVQEFYRLNSISRKDHGLPPQPYSFFKKVYEHILANDFGFVVLASFESKAIAGDVYFHLKEKAVYKYGASDKTFQHLRANNLLMWEGIRECIRRGCRTLSLGRTDLIHEGLLQFKRGWGATEQQTNYYRYDFRKQAFVVGPSRVTGFHNKIFKNIPIPLLNVIGTILYKHMG